jgi:hypothetical protein
MITMPRISALILGLSLVGGCSRTSMDTAPPDDDEVQDDDNSDVSALNSGVALHSPTASGVYIDPTLATVCELSSDDDFFVYDADLADLRVERVLEAVASCVKDGAMAGRRLQLVTYATGRDGDSKPQVHFRTEELRGALMRGGVAGTDILTVSGTGDAVMPQGAEGWPNERRVDIRVLPRRSH